MERLWSEIQEFNGGFAESMDLIEKELLASLSQASPDALYDASRHLILTGGKKVRPALVALAYDAVGGGAKGPEYILPIAIAAELIHTATIIHDDIIDRSTMRRGAKTVNAQWGNDIALIAGDLIFSKAFGLVGAHERREMSEIISGACVHLSEGEVLETLHTGDIRMTEEVYLEIIERKTASLFEACTRCGALLGDGTEAETEALSRYGYLIGIGFQMTDDVLDITAGEGKLGKPVGADIGLGKPTFIILHALKEARGREKALLERVIRGEMKDPKDVKRALDLIRRTNSIEYANKRAEEFIKRAKDELVPLQDSRAKKSLELIADYAIKRDF
ncbi:MAG: polyprenyl synthetase family protein [Euryarchaeota archaeon]|nr:polyprenyl synthetase family protein [Euryarchaeota archaeon]